MIFARLLGAVVGGFGVLSLLRLFGRRRIGRGSFVLFVALSSGLLGVSCFPGLVNVVSDLMLPGQRQYQRLLTLLILSSFMLWILLFWERVKAERRSGQFMRLIKRLGRADFYRRYPDFERFPEVVILIPALNEAENLEALLPRMPIEVDGRQVAVLVVDDGSVDETAAVAERNGARVVQNAINMGGGLALQLGFELAREAGAGFVVTMDADGQHRPEEIPQLLSPLLSETADVVIGSRIIGSREKDSLVRFVGIHVFNRLINFISGTRITDCSNNFRAMRADVLGCLSLMEEQYHTSEFIIEACKADIQLVEVPITVERRKHGTSKKGRSLKYGISFARTIFKSWWR